MRKIIALIILATLGLSFITVTAMAADTTSNKVLKQGIIGAGTGAIAAGASGGKAGKGALIGAGTGILGNILLDTLTEGGQSEPSQQQRQKTTQTVDLYQEAYQEGYADGFREGYKEGIKGAN